MVDPKLAWFTGPCHLLACRNENHHGHLVCPECDSVGFRNPNCVACATAWGGIGPDPNAGVTVPVTDLRQLYRAVACPRCGAEAGRPCRQRDGTSRWEHSGRAKDAIVAYRRTGVRVDG